MEAVELPPINRLLVIAEDLITRFGLNLVAAIAILFVGNWVAKLSRRFVRRIASKSELDPTLTTFLATLIYYGILMLAGVAALNRLGVQTASIVAILGAAGLAVGLALQGSLANFAAGVLLIVFRHFRVGDLVEGAGVFGHVEEIHLFTTSIVTLDNKTVIIPNAKLTDDNITNYSHKGKLRVDMVVGVAYSANIDQVKRILRETLEADERVLADPAPTVAVLELADSSVNFAVRPWVKPEHYIGVQLSTFEHAKKRLDAEGVTIPFPQRDVHIFYDH